MSFRYRIRRNGGYTIISSSGLIAPGSFGDSDMPPILDDIAEGTGTGQANQLYKVPFSLLTTASATYDLKGGGGEVDVLGAALAMIEVRKIEIYISTTPASGVGVRFGPQNVTNGWDGPFSVVTATGYVFIPTEFKIKASFTGQWLVGSTTKILKLNNPGAGTVAGVMLVTGVK